MRERLASGQIWQGATTSEQKRAKQLRCRAVTRLEAGEGERRAAKPTMGSDGCSIALSTHGALGKG